MLFVIIFICATFEIGQCILFGTDNIAEISYLFIYLLYFKEVQYIEKYLGTVKDTISLR